MNWADHILALHRLSGLRRFEFSRDITVDYWFNSNDKGTGTVHYWKVSTGGHPATQHMVHENLHLFFADHPDLELLGAHPA